MYDHALFDTCKSPNQTSGHQITLDCLVIADGHLKVQYGLQSKCKQTCKHLVRCTLYISMYLLTFG